MTSLITVYFFLIIIQRAVSVIFADFPYTSILAQQIFGIFMPVLIYFEFIKKEKCIEKKDLIIKPLHIPIVLVAGFCMQFFGSFINYPVIVLLSKLNVTAPKMADVPDGFKIVYYIILICILPALFEEILFRKFTFKKLSQFGKRKALVLTSVIFGIMHFNPYSVIPLIVAGFFMTYTVYKGFPLIYTILFHFSLNFSGVILDVISKNESVNTLIYNHFALFGIVFGIFTGLFWLFIKKEGFSDD